MVAGDLDILRAAGIIPLHDEATAFAAETAGLREQARGHEARLDWIAALTTFKAVLLEGLEVVFIVIALGAGRGMLIPASVGAKTPSNSPSASCCPRSAYSGPAKGSASPGRVKISRSSYLPRCFWR